MYEERFQSECTKQGHSPWFSKDTQGWALLAVDPGLHGTNLIFDDSTVAQFEGRFVHGLES